MTYLWQLTFSVVVVCTLLSTLRVTVVGLDDMPRNPIARFISHDRWNALLLVLIPWFVGSFARREISPLPWVAYSAARASHGIGDGFLTLAIVVIVELWLFWIPAHSIVLILQETDKRINMLARLLNFTIGLLLVTPDNPIYQLIGLLHPAEQY